MHITDCLQLADCCVLRKYKGHVYLSVYDMAFNYQTASTGICSNVR